MKKFEQACEFLETIVIPFPNLIKVRLEYVEYLRQARRFSQWEVESFRILEEHFSLPLCFRLGRYFLQKKEWPRALSCFNRILENADAEWMKNYATALNSIMGCIYYHLSDFQKARIYLEKSFDPASCYYLARIFEDRGQYGLALRKLEEIKELSESKDYICFAVELARKMGMFDVEKGYLRQLLGVLRTKKGKFSVLQRLERLARKTNDYRLGTDSLRAQLKLQGESSPALKRLADLHWDFGNREQAVRGYLKFLTLQPFDAVVINRLSLYYDEKGMEKEAYKYLKMGHVGGYNTLELDLRYATLAFGCGNFSEAKSCLQGLIGEKGLESRVFWLLSRIYHHEGQEKIARYYADLSRKEGAAA
jgi:tetratricopeptide (TPR) repeat protein